MPMYALRDLPPGLIQRAKARAREDETTLDAVLLAYLEAYAEGRTTAQLASAGGRARAAQMTAEERSEAGRKAVQARWARERGT